MYSIPTIAIVSLLCALVVRADGPPACKDTELTDTGKGFAAFEKSTAVWKWDGEVRPLRVNSSEVLIDAMTIGARFLGGKHLDIGGLHRLVLEMEWQVSQN